MPYVTIMHKCCCGCGQVTVTPLSPTDWKLLYDGETISLYPSIGNWSFDCQSHYWIRRSEVVWASRWTQEQIAAGRAHDQFAKEGYFDTSSTVSADQTRDASEKEQTAKVGLGPWLQLKKWWSKMRRRPR